MVPSAARNLKVNSAIGMNLMFSDASDSHGVFNVYLGLHPYLRDGA